VKFGADRGDINAFYYRQFKGVGVNELMQAGIGWFNLRLEQGSLFKQSTIECLKELQGKGVSPVLVSGSMLPLLNPIAKWLGVKYILCTELVSVAGSLTGELTASAIGSAKRDRILAFLAENKVQADQCYAFGDHISDLPMLETVAWPTAVDPCAQLASVATSRGWPILTSQFFKLNG
jgi:phosphoserine phosphatase